ncbi:MAG TPA: DUF1007 family protein [Xanthobacteraceae bacterium]|nr:DUF1007 family protein [Xanthobacteraceae bacterium]
MIRQLSCIAAAVLASLVATVHSASAHPHVWVTMRSELVYGPDGTVTGVRHAWTFDDMFSAFATQGIDSKQRNVFTREELEPLAKTNVESLKDFDYFTVARVNGKKVDFLDPPSGYYLDYKDQILTLHFTLPLKTPMKAQDVQIEISDPSYFVDFSFEKNNAVALVGAPAGCKLTVVRPEEMDPAMAAKLFQMAPDQKLDPSEYLGAQFASRILVKCS